MRFRVRVNHRRVGRRKVSVDASTRAEARARAADRLRRHDSDYPPVIPDKPKVRPAGSKARRRVERNRRLRPMSGPVKPSKKKRAGRERAKRFR